MKTNLFRGGMLLIAALPFLLSAQVTEVFTKVLHDPDLPTTHYGDQKAEAIMPGLNNGVSVLKRRTPNTWHRVRADFSGNTTYQDTIAPIVNIYNWVAEWNPSQRHGTIVEYHPDSSSTLFLRDSFFANPIGLKAFHPGMDTSVLFAGGGIKAASGHLIVGGAETTRYSPLEGRYSSRAMPFIAVYSSNQNLLWSQMVDVDAIGKMGICSQPSSRGSILINDTTLLLVNKTEYNSNFSAYTWAGYCVTAHHMATGDTLWTRMIPLGADALKSVQATADGGFVFFGVDSAAIGAQTYNISVTKYDATGNFVWKKVYEEFALSDLTVQIQPLMAGGWMGMVSVAGPTVFEEINGLVFRVDDQGDLVWHHEIHQSGYDYPQSFVENNDHSIWVATCNKDFGSGASAITVTKLVDITLSTDVSTSLMATLAPNPARSTLLVTLVQAQPGTHLALYDLQGRSLLTTTTSEAAATLNMEGLAPGVYVLRIVQGGQTAAYKVVKE